MKLPSSTIVVDAAILVAAARGRTSAVLMRASRSVAMITTERAVAEAARRIELGLKQPAMLSVLDRIAEAMIVVPLADLAPRLPHCEAALRDSVPSRNGSTSDAHLLALSWATGADIWTHDRDFAGTGVATWSTANLIVGLEVMAGPEQT